MRAMQRATLPDPVTIREYLMGGLSDAERRSMEQMLFASDDMMERLNETEKELIQDYVHGRLVKRDRERFEMAFLSIPDRLKRVEQMREQAEAPKVERAKFEIPAMAWVGMGGVVLAGLLWSGVIRLPVAGPEGEARPAAVRVEQETAAAVPERRQTALPNAEKRVLPREEKPVAAASEASHEATGAGDPAASAETERPATAATLREGGKAPVLAGGGNVALTLRVQQGGYPAYRAEVRDEAGRVVSRQVGLLKAGNGVRVAVPAGLATGGNYEVVLQGVRAGAEAEEVGRYGFRVENQRR